MAQFEFRLWRHPERSRFPGGAKDLPHAQAFALGRSLTRLNCAGFREDALDKGNKFKLSHYRPDGLLAPNCILLVEWEEKSLACDAIGAANIASATSQSTGPDPLDLIHWT